MISGNKIRIFHVLYPRHSCFFLLKYGIGQYYYPFPNQAYQFLFGHLMFLLININKRVPQTSTSIWIRYIALIGYFQAHESIHILLAYSLHHRSVHFFYYIKVLTTKCQCKLSNAFANYTNRFQIIAYTITVRAVSDNEHTTHPFHTEMLSK